MKIEEQYPWEPKGFYGVPSLKEALASLGIQETKIEEVLEPDAAECIGRVYLNTGKFLRIFGTDLGVWSVETVYPGESYPTLGMLLEDVYQYNYWQGLSDRSTLVYGEDDDVVFESAGRQFVIPTKNLTLQETEIWTHPKGSELLCIAAELGSMWKIQFWRTDWDRFPPYDPTDVDSTPDELRFNLPKETV